MVSYRERLIVEWGEGYRSWVQLANNQDKPVIEIRRTAGDPPFPGFLNFCEHLNSLPSVPQTWREVLSSVKGIYLLINPKTGKKYVGSASGANGFWGRWEEYVASGHGGNVEMRKEPDAEYLVTVLEVASSSAGEQEIRKLEKRWKQKLLTLEFGLNRNL